MRKKTIEQITEVSEECAKEMVETTVKLFKIYMAYSVSGYAGPTGGTKENPTGTICFGFYSQGITTTEKKFFKGNRQEIQNQAVEYIINTLLCSF